MTVIVLRAGSKDGTGVKVGTWPPVSARYLLARPSGTAKARRARLFHICRSVPPAGDFGTHRDGGVA